MPFTLSRGAVNEPLEVQRWQYFLLKQGFSQAGLIDGGFGMNTEKATILFQTKVGVPTTGKLDTKTLDVAETLGYSIKPNNHYSNMAANFPPKPQGLSSPSNASRNNTFKCFKFMQHPMPRRDPDEVVVKGSCDGTDPDWEAAHIITVDMPQLKFALGYGGRFRTHRKALPLFAALFAKWEADDLLHLIINYQGCYYPRYKRGLKPPPPAQGHGIMRSTDAAADRLSNHTFGSAFDINVPDNPFGEPAAATGARGCVRELVAAANALGVYWGGHFNTTDGMHFEISNL